MSAYQRVGIPLLASALTAIAVASAPAQQAWPGDKPAPQQQAWPGDSKPSQQQGSPSDGQPSQQRQSGWPDSGASQQPRGWQSPSSGGQVQQAWPSDRGPARQASAPAGAPLMVPQQGLSPGMGAPPPGGMAMGSPGGANPCIAEFTRLKNEVEKRGSTAKAVNDRKGTREELCTAVTAMHAAQVSWVKYTKENSSKCGIPPDAVKQLRTVEDHFAKMKKNICSSGGPAGPATPSFSQALGTAELPITTDDTAKKRGGVFDTLTGPMQR